MMTYEIEMTLSELLLLSDILMGISEIEMIHSEIKS